MPGWQEPEPSHVTGTALAHCILGKFLGVVCHYVVIYLVKIYAIIVKFYSDI